MMWWWSMLAILTSLGGVFLKSDHLMMLGVVYALVAVAAAIEGKK